MIKRWWCFLTGHEWIEHRTNQGWPVTIYCMRCRSARHIHGS